MHNNKFNSLNLNLIVTYCHAIKLKSIKLNNQLNQSIKFYYHGSYISLNNIRSLSITAVHYNQPL